MYIGIPSSPEEGKKILTSPKFEEATAPIWYSYGLSPSILYHIRHSLSTKTFCKENLNKKEKIRRSGFLIKLYPALGFL